MAKKRTKKSKKDRFFEHLKPDRQRILLLIVLINFMVTAMVVWHSFAPKAQVFQAPVAVNKNARMESEIKKMVQGYPIESMAPLIASKDPQVAAFMVGIAKKESGWGKHKPVLAGRDCFNYWGFRLQTDTMGSGGHTCFDNQKQAVNMVAARIQEMIDQEKIDTPKDMIVWKCGYGCKDEEKSASEKKWISDVGIYNDSLTRNL